MARTHAEPFCFLCSSDHCTYATHSALAGCSSLLQSWCCSAVHCEWSPRVAKPSYSAYGRQKTLYLLTDYLAKFTACCVAHSLPAVEHSHPWVVMGICMVGLVQTSYSMCSITIHSQKFYFTILLADEQLCSLLFDMAFKMTGLLKCIGEEKHF